VVADVDSISIGYTDTDYNVVARTALCMNAVRLQGLNWSIDPRHQCPTECLNRGDLPSLRNISTIDSSLLFEDDGVSSCSLLGIGTPIRMRNKSSSNRHSSASWARRRRSLSSTACVCHIAWGSFDSSGCDGDEISDFVVSLPCDLEDAAYSTNPGGGWPDWYASARASIALAGGSVLGDVGDGGIWASKGDCGFVSTGLGRRGERGRGDSARGSSTTGIA